MSNPNLNAADDPPTKINKDITAQNTEDAPSKLEENPPPKPSPSDGDPLSSPGFILVALTSTLFCWSTTGIIGYKSPAAPVSEDQTFLAMVLWMFQLGSSACLVGAAVSKGWSTPAAMMSASIVGLGATVGYGVCYAEWGNAATWAFWIALGVYGALVGEARVGLMEGVERGIARAMEGGKRE